MRVTNGAEKLRSKRRLMKRVKGQFGGRSKLYATAKQTLRRMLQYAYRDRRVRKREFRTLWILRINAAARMRGISYSRLVHGLAVAGVAIDRKLLAHLAVSDPGTFDHLVTTAKAKLN